MKIKKGHLPRIAGRPASDIDTQKVVSPLHIPLVLASQRYTALVKSGQALKSGHSLAQLEVPGGALHIPAPYSGTVEQVDIEKDFICLNVSKPNPQPWSRPTFADPTVLEDRVAREHLAAAGIWPSIWDSASGGIPPLNATEPKAIVVKAVVTEPFRARGNVILENNLELFLQGLSYLERLGADYAPIYLILTHASHPLAQQIKKAMAGSAWLRPVFIPLTYPLANNRYLWRCLRQSESNLGKDDSVWFLDTQAVVDIARCLGEGLVPARRMVTLGGPGYPQGQHVSVPVGTPLAKLCSNLNSFEGLRVLRGGIFTGQVVDPNQTVVEHLDDGFTFLDEDKGREFLSFGRIGFDKPSHTLGYASALLPGRAMKTSAALRGERRACIACGHCEGVCPVSIMPHLIWRFLEKGMLEEAQMAGTEICVECGLCSYVCPSKIELAETISKGIDRIRDELVTEAEAQEVKS